MNPYFFCRFDRRPADINDDMMVVFQATNEFDDASFSNEIEREVARALEPDELIYLVRQSSFDAAKEALSRSSGIKRIEKRTRVVVVGYGPDGSEAGKMKLSGNGEPSSITLDEIRRRCGTAIFLDRHGFMEANASFHFENPSGNHTDRFIRLSNILVRQAEIAFLGFTILPLIPSEVDHVYIDTPSLFAVVASANEQLKSLVSGRRDLLADNFRSYDGVDDYDFTHLSQAVALVSASASGSLAGRLMKRGFVADRIGHVLYLSDKPAKTKVAINLSSDAMTNPDGLTGSRNMYSKEECQLCKDGSHPVPLRGDQFDIAAPQPFPLVLKRRCLSP